MKRGRRGFVLIATAVSAVAMIAIAGLAVDLGRVYIVKNELQTFADSAALAAVLELDGTEAGLTRAQAAVNSAANNNKWNLGAAAVTGPGIQFATATGDWRPPAAAGAASTRVHVTASVSVSLALLPVLGLTSSSVSAAASAGQLVRGTVPVGAFPFAVPKRRNGIVQAPNFGLALHHSYALRPGKNSDCTGDVSSPPAGEGGVFGGSNQEIWDAIAGNGLTGPISVGSHLEMPPGQRNSILNNGWTARFDRSGTSDTDVTSTTYAQYSAAGLGNGRRVIVAPIIDPAAANVIGFGAFFLLEWDGGGQIPACAEYVGSYMQGAARAGGGSGGYVEARLRP